MDNIWTIVAVVAIVAMIVYLIYKLKPQKNDVSENSDSVSYYGVRFEVTFTNSTDEVDLFELTGSVKEEIIRVGDSFRWVDENNNIIAPKVVVEKIDLGVVRKKLAEEADVEEVVTLAVRVYGDTLTDMDFEFKTMYLKK